ncbi:PorV/PorQ family protein, partial [bacterium]
MLLTVCLFMPVAGAQVNLDKAGQSTMNFQLVSVSARASALGEAFYAVCNGAGALFFNPAGMAEMKNTRDLDLMYTGWIADISYAGGAFAWSLGDVGTIGLSALVVDYGTIHETRLLSASSQTQDVAYEDVGELPNVGAYSFGLSYARALSREFSIGGTVRYTGQNLGRSLLATGMKGNSASVLVFDVGVKYYTGFRSFRFGMAFRNFGTQVKREQIEEQLPLTFTLGAAMDMFDLVDPGHSQETSMTLGVDFLHSNNYSERVNMGVEYITMGMFALRGGYQTNRDIGSWSAGVGFFTSVEDYDLRFDYSYSQMKYF